LEFEDDGIETEVEEVEEEEEEEEEEESEEALAWQYSSQVKGVGVTTLIP
jgi:hypothetical protein